MSDIHSPVVERVKKYIQLAYDEMCGDIKLYHDEVERYRSIISQARHQIGFDNIDEAFSILSKAIGLPRKKRVQEPENKPNNLRVDSYLRVLKEIRREVNRRAFGGPYNSDEEHKEALALLANLPDVIFNLVTNVLEDGYQPPEAIAEGEST